jgi:hypothetical protein
MDQSKVSRWVEVSFQWDVLHDVEGAKGKASQHRHRVTFSVRVNVRHAEREIEYYGLREYCQSLLPGDAQNVGSTSLEQLGEQLLVKLVAKYPGRVWEIRVMEDVASGAVIQYSEAA